MKPINVGLLGIGTVGGGTWDVLSRNADEIQRRAGRAIRISLVADKDVARAKKIVKGKAKVISDGAALVRSPEIEIVVELIGGTTIAKELVLEAIRHGKHVVTANKALLATHGNEIFAAAQKKGVMVAFEASVAGGVPIIKALREGLAANRIEWIAGIINGTSNFILSEMRDKGIAFEQALQDAQSRGYAEADPTFDIEGHDTAQKLAILASLAFGIKVDQSAVYVEGISSIASEDLEWADELGYRVKLLGVAVRTDIGIEQRVHPTMVPKDTAIAQVMGVTNAVTVDADAITPITLVGPGAGGMATASSVVSDIGDIARGVRTAPFGRPTGRLTVSKKAPMQRHEGGYYIRLLAVDKPGTAATIAKRLAQQNISLESIVQRHRGERPHGGDVPGRSSEPVPVILITYATTEDAVRKALAAVDRDKVVLGKPQVIRIEKN